MPQGVEYLIEAYVLPYLDRSAGVVFWEPRRLARSVASPASANRLPAAGTGRAGSHQVHQLAIYAPGELSPGEMAVLHDGYVASLGRALREGARLPAGEWVLRWWWLAGVLGAALLAVRALEFGPGYAWLALAAAVTALPLNTTGVGGPFRSRRAAMAGRLARRAASLVPHAGADARFQERLAGLWRLARQLQGPPRQQLRELEAYCWEHAWRQAAQFYADQQELLGKDRRSGWRIWLTGWWWGVVKRPVQYTVMDLRLW